MKSLLLRIALGLMVCEGGAASQAAPPRLVRVSFEYLETCEVGPECKPIVVSRRQGELVELVLPKLLRTSVTLWDEENLKLFTNRAGSYKSIKQVSGGGVGDEHEILLPLSQLQDGTYYVWVVGDSVGGIFQIQLKTV